MHTESAMALAGVDGSGNDETKLAGGFSDGREASDGRVKSASVAWRGGHVGSGRWGRGR